MFEPNLSIDVSLLAIILGLYATKNDKNLVLILICCLFAHVLLTHDDYDRDGADTPDGDALGIIVEDVVGDQTEPELVAEILPGMKLKLKQQTIISKPPCRRECSIAS